MKKVIITTLIWQRPQIFDIWARQIKKIIHQSDKTAFDIQVVCCGSEGGVSMALAQKYNFLYVEAPNLPLGRKANLRLDYIRQLDPDYVLFLGSDDLMSVRTWKKYEIWIHRGFEEICSMDIYLFNMLDRQAAYSTGYIGTHRDGEPMAVGRLLNKRLLNLAGWKLWDDTRRFGLDGSSKRVLMGIEAKRKYYYHRHEGTIIVDLKSDTNIGRFNVKEGNRVICEAEPIINEFII